MAEKQFNTRILLRYDTLANWTITSTANIKGNLVLKPGEVAIAHVPGDTIITEGKATQITPPTDLFKVGDGSTPFKDLPWASGLGADVYAWAKANGIFISTSGSGNVVTDITWEASLNQGKGGILVTKGSAANTTYAFSEGAVNGSFIIDPSDGDSYAVSIHGLGTAAFTSSSDYATAAQGAKADAAMPKSGGTFTGPIYLASDPVDSTQAVTKGYVDSVITAATAGLSGAMHLIGSTTDAITDGGTQDITVSGYSGIIKTAGNVILFDNKEFVWTGTIWELLGDEGSYALKTVSISAGGGLTGGGDLTQSRTISHAIVSDNVADSLGTQGTFIKAVSRDAYGHVVGVISDTFLDKYRQIKVNNNTFLSETEPDPIVFVNGSGISITTNSENGCKITIGHSNAVTAASESIGVTSSGTASAIVSAGNQYVSFPILTYDAQGHITNSQRMVLKFNIDTAPTINTTITTSLTPQEAAWNSQYQLNRIARTAKFSHLLQNTDDDEIILCGGNASGFPWKADSTPGTDNT